MIYNVFQVFICHQNWGLIKKKKFGTYRIYGKDTRPAESLWLG